MPRLKTIKRRPPPLPIVPDAEGVKPVSDLLLDAKYEAVIRVVNRKLLAGFVGNDNALLLLKAIAQVRLGKKKTANRTLHHLVVPYACKSHVTGSRWYGLAPELRTLVPRSLLKELDVAVKAGPKERLDPRLDNHRPGQWRQSTSLGPRLMSDRERSILTRHRALKKAARMERKARKEMNLSVATRANKLMKEIGGQQPWTFWGSLPTEGAGMVALSLPDMPEPTEDKGMPRPFTSGATLDEEVKAEQEVKQAARMAEAEATLAAACVPCKPAPSSDDLLRTYSPRAASLRPHTDSNPPSPPEVFEEDPVTSFYDKASPSPVRRPSPKSRRRSSGLVMPAATYRVANLGTLPLEAMAMQAESPYTTDTEDTGTVISNPLEDGNPPPRLITVA